jgi:hypothetical protein
MGSYGAEIGRAWYSWKACEVYSSLIQKKKMEKKLYSLHKLPKLQSTKFWSREILGLKQCLP